MSGTSHHGHAVLARRTVLSRKCFLALPRLEGGNAVRFFCVFCVWFGVLLSFFFFTVLLFLGSLFEKIFGSELLFLGVVVGLVFFDSVLPRFSFYYLVFSSENVSEKFS